jgi:hypothetical protein
VGAAQVEGRGRLGCEDALLLPLAVIRKDVVPNRKFWERENGKPNYWQ